MPLVFHDQPLTRYWLLPLLLIFCLLLKPGYFPHIPITLLGPSTMSIVFFLILNPARVLGASLYLSILLVPIMFVVFLIPPTFPPITFPALLPTLSSTVSIFHHHSQMKPRSPFYNCSHYTTPIRTGPSFVTTLMPVLGPLLGPSPDTTRFSATTLDPD